MWLLQAETGIYKLKNNRYPECGFTLIEMLIVIGIVLFLFALIAVGVGPLREKMQIARTKETLKRVAVALSSYEALNQHNYPSIPVIGDLNPDTCPYSSITPLAADVAFWKGIDLEKQLLIGSGSDEFKTSDVDSTGKYLIDAWGNRLKYRKLSRSQYVVWSLGPPRGNPLQFHDDIGTGNYYDESVKAFKTPPAPINYCERDLYITASGAKYVGPNITTKD